MKNNVIIFMPSIDGGGVEKNLFIVSNYLSGEVKTLKVLTISKKFRKKFKKSVQLITPKSGIWDKFPRRFKYFLSIILLVREILKSRNVIVLSFQANIYCILICKLFSIKVISRSNTDPIGWSKNFLRKLVFTYGLNLADKILVNSIEFKKNLKKEFNVNAVCIYNPLNVKEILSKSKKKSIKIFKTNKKIKIINVGRLAEQKDQFTLLRSFVKIKGIIEFEACIIGDGKLKNKLQNFIEKNGLQKSVKLLGWSKNPFPLIKQSNLFILTSKFEGLPNVLLESLVLKKFIISSDCKTGPKEILLNGKGGILFKVSDYKSLAKKIEYYSKNKNKCQKMMMNSYRSLKRFDYDNNLKKYLKLIENLNSY